MLDLWAPADCTCSAFCSDPDGLRANGLTFAAEADKPARDGTLNFILNYTPVGYKMGFRCRRCILSHASG